VLEGIVKQQVAAGDMLGALQLAHAISDLFIRTATLSIIAWGQTKEDDIEGALKTLDGIDDVSRDSLLVNLVESRSRHHHLRRARQLAAAIHDSGKHLSAERYIEAHSFPLKTRSHSYASYESTGTALSRLKHGFESRWDHHSSADLAAFTATCGV
jgi:hypothetical protein